MTEDFTYLTYKYRLKDSNHVNYLEQLSREVNFVWNRLREYHEKTMDKWAAGSAKIHWLTHFDLTRLTGGCQGLLTIHSDSIAEICRYFTQSRDKHKKKPKGRFSEEPKRSLGWIPFKNRSITKLLFNSFRYKKRKFNFWQDRPLEGEFKNGCFVQDASGKWFICFVCKVLNNKTPAATSTIGIDLGYSTFATLSNGTKIKHEKEYQKLGEAIGKSQRGKTNKKTKVLHRKAANKRKHFLHQISHQLTKNHNYIVVGDLNSKWMSQNGFGKSVTDTSHGMFKHMLLYKSARRRGVCVITNEAYTTQVCSECGIKPPQRPKGRKNLGMREWICECGAGHDRDVNAARNILKLGLERQPPVEGIFVCESIIDSR